SDAAIQPATTLAGAFGLSVLERNRLHVYCAENIEPLLVVDDRQLMVQIAGLERDFYALPRCGSHREIVLRQLPREILDRHLCRVARIDERRCMSVLDVKLHVAPPRRLPFEREGESGGTVGVGSGGEPDRALAGVVPELESGRVHAVVALKSD